MRFLHTSDWHLGHKLYGRSRHREHLDFLNWLSTTIEKRNIEALLIAGDIFDTQTPSNKTLTLYYRFLSLIAGSSCRHVIIVGGNHDSPALLNAPREILGFLNIHIIGRVPDSIDDEIITLRDRDNQPRLMVLAAPYLRDRDIRSTLAGETLEEKDQKLLNGIVDHYSSLYEHARSQQAELDSPVPIVAMGHLFCQGGQTVEGDGLRDLYIGSLAHVDSTAFNDDIAYLALGHLHQMQRVGKKDNRRYSGSPLLMNFQEAQSRKFVLEVECTQNTCVTEIEIPVFQRLEKISGSMEEILTAISLLRAENQSIFLEIHYLGKALADDLQDRVYSAVKGSKLEVLRINNRQIFDHILQQTTEIKTLEELSPEQVFQQCLDLHEIPPIQQKEMHTAFAITMAALQEENDADEE